MHKFALLVLVVFFSARFLDYYKNNLSWPGAEYISDVDFTTAAVAGIVAAMLAGVLTIAVRKTLSDAIQRAVADMTALSIESRNEINQANRITHHFNEQSTEWIAKMNEKMNKHVTTWDVYVQSRLVNLHQETGRGLRDVQKKLHKLSYAKDIYVRRLESNTRKAEQLGTAMETFKDQVESSDRFNDGVASSTVHLERVLKQCDEVLKRCEGIESQFRRIPKAYTARQLTVFGMAAVALVFSILALTMAG